MKVIYKYPLAAANLQTIKMPEDAELLCVQMQKGEPCLWAMVDPSKSDEDRRIEILCTGEEVIEDMGVDRKYISTIQAFDGTYIYHVFERL